MFFEVSWISFHDLDTIYCIFQIVSLLLHLDKKLTRMC